MLAAYFTRLQKDITIGFALQSGTSMACISCCRNSSSHQIGTSRLFFCCHKISYSHNWSASLPSKANIRTEEYVQLLCSMCHLPEKPPLPWTQLQPTIHHNPKSQEQGNSDSKGDKCGTHTLTQCTELQ